MRAPIVDVVIPVHQGTRPIERAVASVIDGTELARAIVVCHDMDTSVLADRLAPFGEHVTVLSHRDDVRSPAGPLNAGLFAATAQWVTCMGSDDFYAPGAPRAWADHLRRRPVDVLFLRTFHQERGSFEMLPVRPGRLHDLDMVRDRLCYRIGPQFLLRRDVMTRHGIRMTPGLPVGEDLGYSTHAYSVAEHVDLMAPSAPAYVVGADGGPRVTKGPVDIARQMRPPAALLEEPWLADLLTAEPTKVRSIAIRVLRTSIFPYLHARGADATPDDIAQVRTTVRAWLNLVPDARLPLAIAEQRLVDSLLGAATDREVILAVRSAVAGPLWLRGLPAHPLHALDPESRVRQLAAVLLSDGRRAPSPQLPAPNQA